ncbi:c-type cytochrome [Pseudomonas typographi]
MLGLLALLSVAGCEQKAQGPATADATNGQKLFVRLCGGCHKAGPDARNSFGPRLDGVIGRQAGSLADYAYSPAMKQAGFTWTDAKLRQYLGKPGDVVPGTKMYFWGLSDPAQFADLLAYLKSQ